MVFNILRLANVIRFRVLQRSTTPDSTHNNISLTIAYYYVLPHWYLLFVDSHYRNKMFKVRILREGRDVKNEMITLTLCSFPAQRLTSLNKKNRVDKDGETLQDMINKFKKKRIEQTLVNDLLRQRRESLMKIDDDMRRRSPTKLWEAVTASRADILRITHARKSHDNIVDDIRRSLNETDEYLPPRDEEIERYIENIPIPDDIHVAEIHTSPRERRRSSVECDKHSVCRERKRSLEEEFKDVIKARRRSVGSIQGVYDRNRTRRRSREETEGINGLNEVNLGPFHRRKSLQLERERPKGRRMSRPKVLLDDQTDIQALRNIQRELPTYAISRPPPVYLSERYVKKAKGKKQRGGIEKEQDIGFGLGFNVKPSASKRNAFNDTMNKLRGHELTESGRKYLKKKSPQQKEEDSNECDKLDIPQMEREYTCNWELVSEVSSDDDPTADETWDDVRRCKYLRGYDPPEMIMPKEEVNVFVFGRNENDILDMKRAERRRSLSPSAESVPEEICVK